MLFDSAFEEELVLGIQLAELGDRRDDTIENSLFSRDMSGRMVATKGEGVRLHADRGKIGTEFTLLLKVKNKGKGLVVTRSSTGDGERRTLLLVGRTSSGGLEGLLFLLARRRLLVRHLA